MQNSNIYIYIYIFLIYYILYIYIYIYIYIYMYIYTCLTHSEYTVLTILCMALIVTIYTYSIHCLVWYVRPILYDLSVVIIR